LSIEGKKIVKTLSTQVHFLRYYVLKKKEK